MNAERLLAQFERISDAPDAIPRLRRFILDLAVRGKLVEQDPEDEPAEELLGRILELKIRSAGKLPKSDLQLIDRLFNDEPFALPDSWTWVVLGQITDLITSGSRDWAKHYSDSGAIFVRMGNLVKGDYRLRLDSIQHVSPPAGGEGTRTRLDAWDVLVSITGDVGMLGLIPEGFGEAYINQHTALARPCFLLKGRYLPEFLRSDFAQNQFQEPQRGIKNSFRLSDLSAIVVPLPPLAEQHRIVAKVDELMALCDQLEAARQKREQGRERLLASTLQRLNQPAEDPASFRKDASFALQVLPSLTTTSAQIKQLRQTILNLAVRGKLVEQDPEDEPAEELLARFAEAKIEIKRATGDARIKVADDACPDSLPMSLPPTWECQSFQNLFLFIDYRGNTPPKTTDGVPLITAKNVRMGYLDREPREYVSPQTLVAWMTRGLPRLGDLFFTTEAPLGNVCINNIDEPFALAQRVICLQPYSEISTRFVMYTLMSSDMQEMIEAQATGLTAKGIKAAKLKPLPIPLPPLAEQHRIVAKVDELMALCDQLERQLSQADQQRRRLLEAVLAEALGDLEKMLEVA
jgi:type I restriction enzyme S subunit